MEAGFIALIVVAFIVGLVLGLRISRSKANDAEIQGIVYADCSDPGHKPSLFLDLTVPITDIVARKQVAFRVHVLKQNSQK